MRASHDLTRVSASRDESNLVPSAGLLPAAALAQRLGLAELLDDRLRLARDGGNGGAKALTVIGSMLRAGATGELFDDTRAPSTVGSWLRAFQWCNVRQLDAVSRELLARCGAAGAGSARSGRADDAGPGLDDRVGFGYTKVRGYHPLFATCAETGDVVFARLRGGSAGSARCAKGFLTETISRIRHAGVTGQLTVRADSASYSKATLATAARFRRAVPGDRAAEPGHPPGDRRDPGCGVDPDPVLAVHPESLRRRCRRDHLHLLRRHPAHPRAAAGRGPGPPDTGQPARAIRDLRQPRVRHRPGRRTRRGRGRPSPSRRRRTDHRRVEARRARAPAVGPFMANAAWLALAVMAHNLGHAVGSLAGPEMDRATAPTLRRRLFTNARAAGALCPSPALESTRELAMGGIVTLSACGDRRAGRPLLNIATRPHYPRTGDAGRPAEPARPITPAAPTHRLRGRQTPPSHSASESGLSDDGGRPTTGPAWREARGPGVRDKLMTSRTLAGRGTAGTC